MTKHNERAPGKPRGKVMVTLKKGGAPLKVIDLVEVERLASKGLTPGAIACRLVPPVDSRTLKARMEVDEALRETVERGWAFRQEELLDDMKEHSKKNVIGTIFSLKQAHLGGWTDTKEPLTGAITVNVFNGVSTPSGEPEIKEVREVRTIPPNPRRSEE